MQKTILNNLLKNKASYNNRQLIKQGFKQYSSKKHNTNWDYHVDWLINNILTNKLSLTKLLLGVNTAIFLYSWLKPSKQKRFEAQSGISFSPINASNRDYFSLFASLLGSRRIDDFVLDTAILATIGTTLEKTHGTPFIFKVFMVSFYMGMLSSMFWVDSDHAIRKRYILRDPLARDVQGEYDIVKFCSIHGFSMSLVYFFLYKRMKLLMLPVAAVDYCVWGPYYSNGLMNGLAWGMIL